MSHRNHKKPRVLFVLRKRDTSWGQPYAYSYNSSGLLNSATFIKDMLIEAGFEAKLVEVGDGNGIDREVFQYNPDVVILEAIWCPPSKLRELVKLNHHKHRKWIVRNHSELPFLSMEGIALQWVLEYATISNVFVSCNSPTANAEFDEIVKIRTGERKNVLLLPNYYPTKDSQVKKFKERDVVDVGCFGAIRPLKNILQQAVAAIFFANDLKKKLRFHINATRLEGHAEPILKSIRALFTDTPNCELIEEPWMNHDEFLKLCHTMDMGLQVSYSETFNIVAADLITQGIPVICSDEIPWLLKINYADPNSAIDIAECMISTYGRRVHEELQSLANYSEDSKHLWVEELKEIIK
jgi:glycosyltransferase involved in cell wall biosynthesis